MLCTNIYMHVTNNGLVTFQVHYGRYYILMLVEFFEKAAIG